MTVETVVEIDGAMLRTEEDVAMVGKVVGEVLAVFTPGTAVWVPEVGEPEA